MFQRKKSTKELHNNDEIEKDAEITTQKKRHISPEERKVPKKHAWIKVNIKKEKQMINKLKLAQ